jgi:predicted RNase H-like HicB family nuclease
MNKYEIILYWSEDDGAYIAEVPELPGCMAHGTTQIDAVTNANQAIELWVETARETGRPVPEPKGRKLTYA